MELVEVVSMLLLLDMGGCAQCGGEWRGLGRQTPSTKTRVVLLLELLVDAHLKLHLAQQPRRLARGEVWSTAAVVLGLLVAWCKLVRVVVRVVMVVLRSAT